MVREGVRGPRAGGEHGKVQDADKKGIAMLNSFAAGQFERTGGSSNGN